MPAQLEFLRVFRTKRELSDPSNPYMTIVKRMLNFNGGQVWTVQSFRHCNAAEVLTLIHHTKKFPGASAKAVRSWQTVRRLLLNIAQFQCSRCYVFFSRRCKRGHHVETAHRIGAVFKLQESWFPRMKDMSYCCLVCFWSSTDMYNFYTHLKNDHRPLFQALGLPLAVPKSSASDVDMLRRVVMRTDVVDGVKVRTKCLSDSFYSQIYLPTPDSTPAPSDVDK